MLEKFWLSTIILPLLAVLLKSEIANIYKSWSVFKSYSFDEDRDPNTPDRCQIFNESTGHWEDVLITRYAFSLNKNKRGVFVLHPVDGKLGKNKEWAAECISLLRWADMRKRRFPQPLEPDMEKFIADQ